MADTELKALLQRFPYSREIAAVNVLQAAESCEQFETETLVLAAHRLEETGASEALARVLGELERRSDAALDLSWLKHLTAPAASGPILVATHWAYGGSQEDWMLHLVAAQAISTLATQHPNLHLAHVTYSRDTREVPGWKRLPSLIRSVNDIPWGLGVRRPFVPDIFRAAAREASATGCAYFAVALPGVILSSTFLRAVAWLQEASLEATAITPTATAIAGPAVPAQWRMLQFGQVGAIVCSTEWWLKNEALFGDYAWGAAGWETAYTAKLAAYSRFYYASTLRGAALLHRSLPLAPSHDPAARVNQTLSTEQDSPHILAHEAYCASISDFVKVHRSLPTFTRNKGLQAVFGRMPRVTATERKEAPGKPAASAPAQALSLAALRDLSATKTLFVNGCSNSAGLDTPDGTYEYDHANVFGGVLHRRLGFGGYHNLAFGGGSNARIVRKTMAWIAEHHLGAGKRPEDLFVIIGWATPDRREFCWERTKEILFPSPDGIHPFSIGIYNADRFEGQCKQFWKSYIAYGQSDLLDMWVWLTQIIGLQAFFQQHRIPYIMFNSSAAPKPMDAEQAALCRLINVEHYHKPFDEKAHMVGILPREGFPTGKTGHLFAPAHERWADVLQPLVLDALQRTAKA